MQCINQPPPPLLEHLHESKASSLCIR
jgi:hypothetical protein